MRFRFKYSIWKRIYDKFSSLFNPDWSESRAKATHIALQLFEDCVLSPSDGLINDVKYYAISMYMRLRVISLGTFCAVAPNYHVR